jgi:hypothetical protein
VRSLLNPSEAIRMYAASDGNRLLLEAVWGHWIAHTGLPDSVYNYSLLTRILEEPSGLARLYRTKNWRLSKVQDWWRVGYAGGVFHGYCPLFMDTGESTRPLEGLQGWWILWKKRVTKKDIMYNVTKHWKWRTVGTMGWAHTTASFSVQILKYLQNTFSTFPFWILKSNAWKIQLMKKKLKYASFFIYINSYKKIPKNSRQQTIFKSTKHIFQWFQQYCPALLKTCPSEKVF